MARQALLGERLPARIASSRRFAPTWSRVDVVSGVARPGARIASGSHRAIVVAQIADLRVVAHEAIVLALDDEPDILR